MPRRPPKKDPEGGPLVSMTYGGLHVLTYLSSRYGEPTFCSTESPSFEWDTPRIMLSLKPGEEHCRVLDDHSPGFFEVVGFCVTHHVECSPLLPEELLQEHDGVEENPPAKDKQH